MMIPSPPSAGIAAVLPSQNEFAAAFFTEAVRHLEDARILHTRKRFAAAITSSMKAAEFAVKAALILEGGFGFLDKLFGSHKPLIDAANHPLFKRVEVVLEAYRSGLANDVKVLEALAPKPFGADRFAADETNTEYPFLERMMHLDGYSTARLISPHTRFATAESTQHYTVAREAVIGISRSYQDRLPRRLPIPTTI